MGRDIVVGAEMIAHQAEQPLLGRLRLLARHAEEIHAEQHVLPPRQPVGKLGRQPPAQPVRDRVLRRARHDIARRTLQHCHVRGGFRHRRDERDGGGAAADHDDVLTRIVEVGGPELRVDDAAGEALGALERGRVALVVIVIARAHAEEVARIAERAVGPVRLHRPARLGGGPARRQYLGAEAYVAVDAVGLGGLLDIGADRGAVGDRLGVRPGVEGEAERVHVAVRPDAGIAKQVPCPADAAARLEDGVRAVGAAFLQVEALADAGDAGPHHDHVQVLGHRSSRPLSGCDRGRTLVSEGRHPGVLPPQSDGGAARLNIPWNTSAAGCCRSASRPRSGS